MAPRSPVLAVVLHLAFAGDPGGARLTVVVYAHRCPDCGHEWAHKDRF